MKLPVTLRGTLVVLCAGYLLWGPAQSSADIVAATLAASTLGIWFLLQLITILKGYQLKKSLTASVHAPEERIFSNSNITSVLKLSPISIPPLYSLSAKIIFSEDSIQTTTFQLKGSSDKARLITENLVFPHRGEWKVEKILFSFEDLFGLSKLSWEIQTHSAAFRIFPKRKLFQALPILSSSQTVGDTIQSHQERTGDPFDLKKYHPSDGMRKILWKVYAKSGELISRHPERSMTPEGKVLIFAAATRRDDDTVSMALQYMESLDELDLDVYFASLGLKKSEQQIAITPDQAENQALQTAFEANFKPEEALIRDVQELVDFTNNSSDSSTISHLLVFTSEQSAREVGSIEALQALGNYLNLQQIQPIFIIREEKQSPSKSSRSKFHHFIYDETTPELNNPEHFPRFLKDCAEADWEVIMQ
ncbi:MAG: DUF58 domain-containing protein [Deltaproteobacteria bacterium]|nr:DUF58 domain-containing protein [Deltaproteobacteria bacterium]